MLKQSYLTLTTTFLMVLKQLSQVLHVLQTAWLQWLKLLQDNFGVERRFDDYYPRLHW